MAEIAAASQEQSAGIEQVNKAVMQLDELTQQNAALVEEASAASQAMAEQARGLNDLMERVQRGGACAARRAAQADGGAAGGAAQRRKPTRELDGAPAGRWRATGTDDGGRGRNSERSEAGVEASGTNTCSG